MQNGNIIEHFNQPTLENFKICLIAASGNIINGTELYNMINCNSPQKDKSFCFSPALTEFEDDDLFGRIYKSHTIWTNI